MLQLSRTAKKVTGRGKVVICFFSPQLLNGISLLCYQMSKKGNVKEAGVEKDLLLFIKSC